jgi:hypothetical protein
MSEGSATQGTTQDDNTAAQIHRPIILVDASNVAFAGNSGPHQPRLRRLIRVLEEIREARIPVLVIADASLRHRIDDRNGLEQLIRNGFVLQAPAGCDADRFLAQLAVKRAKEGHRPLILTDDLLREYPDAEPFRFPFLVVSDSEVLFYTPLSSLMPANSLLDAVTAVAENKAQA